MERWALTGGIASGKSTVADLLVAFGVPVIDADRIYHALIAPDPVTQAPSALAQQIAQAFPGILMADGKIDRPNLGAVVFASTQQRAMLEAITHPAVQAKAQQMFAALADAGHTHAFYDVPLLFERNLQKNYAQVVVVWVPKQLQLTRMMARDALTAQAAELRLASQLPLDDKRKQAHHIIDNSGAKEKTRQQVQHLVQRM